MPKMSVWKITGISLLAASIMGAFLLLAFPAYAQRCFHSDEIFKLTDKTDGLEAKRIKGEKFTEFMDATENKFGPYPDPIRPDHIVIMFATKIPTARVYFVHEDGSTCRMITISKAQADGILKTAFGVPV